MAKKIIIEFSSNPVPGTLISPTNGFEYSIYINGSSIVYDTGLENVFCQFVAFGTIGYNPQFVVEVQPTLQETISAVVNLLTTMHSHPSVIYSIVGNSIEVYLKTNEYTIINFGASNANITTTSEIVTDDFINLKYFFQYKNIVNEEYICRIYKKNYTGSALEIHGKAIIEKGAVKDHLDPIRGGGLSLELEASVAVTLEDLYTENEQDFTVRLYRNNALIFFGYINPEGVYQSFTEEAWVINLDCVDGLGALSNLSFVDPLGFPFTGKMKAIDVIYYCLFRSGFYLPINVSVNTFYDGLTIDHTTDILAKIYLNGDRFQKIDNDTIMSCDEVLKSVLDLFCACVTQQNGEWYIYKPNELFNSSFVDFKRYDINNNYTGNNLLNLTKLLGSNINNFYPHHCSGNQKIQIKGSISKYRVNYKYGFVSGVLKNSKLVKETFFGYDGWTILRPSDMVNDPLSATGFIIKTSPSFPLTQLIVADGVTLVTGDTLTLKISYSVINPDDGSYGGCNLKMVLKIGTYFLSGRVASSPSLSKVFAWKTSPSIDDDEIVIELLKAGTVEISIPPIPVDGVLELSIERAISFLGNDRIANISFLDLIPNLEGRLEIGEFHTVERAIRVSSNVKEVKTIYNGDNAGIVYLGAIFKEDKVTPTETWSRKGRLESFPLLRIASEEELRISQKPLKIFTGSIYGFIPYLSVININNVGSKFMFIEYSYDTMTNMGNYKLLELFADEIQDIIYKFTYDYGNTVKPTIVS